MRLLQKFKVNIKNEEYIGRVVAIYFPRKNCPLSANIEILEVIKGEKSVGDFIKVTREHITYI